MAGVTLGKKRRALCKCLEDRVRLCPDLPSAVFNDRNLPDGIFSAEPGFMLFAAENIHPPNGEGKAEMAEERSYPPTVSGKPVVIEGKLRHARRMAHRA
jgi:hypothetical protein